MSKVSDELRKEFGENDARRDAGLVTPEDVVRYDNLAYGNDPQWNILDVYRPKGEEGKLPVIVIVHGGGWVYGTKEVYQFYGMGLAQRGFAVVNYTYRLAPEHKFPAQLEDTNQVIRWISANKEQYGFDENNIFAVGDSAGGHLLGLYCAICTDSAYAARYSFSVPEDFSFRAIGMNCGAYKLFEDRKAVDTDGMLRTEALMRDLLPEDSYEEMLPWLNVIDVVNPKFPPVYIMTAVGDYLIKQAPMLEEACKKNHVPYVLKVYGDEKQPLYHVFHVTMQEPAARQCNDDECGFFRERIQ